MEIQIHDNLSYSEADIGPQWPWEMHLFAPFFFAGATLLHILIPMVLQCCWSRGQTHLFDLHINHLVMGKVRAVVKMLNATEAFMETVLLSIFHMSPDGLQYLQRLCRSSNDLQSFYSQTSLISAWPRSIPNPNPYPWIVLIRDSEECL